MKVVSTVLRTGHVDTRCSLLHFGLGGPYPTPSIDFPLMGCVNGTPNQGVEPVLKRMDELLWRFRIRYTNPGF